MSPLIKVGNFWIRRSALFAYLSVPSQSLLVINPGLLRLEFKVFFESKEKLDHAVSVLDALFETGDGK